MERQNIPQDLPQTLQVPLILYLLKILWQWLQAFQITSSLVKTVVWEILYN